MKNKTSIHLDGGAFVCGHVAKSQRPILFAARDEPALPEDTGWQFLCNLPEPEDIQEAQVWSLHEVITLEPSLAAYLNCPAGTVITRNNQVSQWISVGESNCDAREMPIPKDE